MASKKILRKRTAAPKKALYMDYNALSVARPSVLEGLARIFDFTGSLDRLDRGVPSYTDIESLAADWRAVGDDLRAASAAYETEMRVSMPW